MRIAILSRYQNTANRGVESFAKELVKRLSKNNQVEILVSEDSDNLGKLITGNYDIVMPLNGRLQSLKVSIGRLFGGYKLVIGSHSGKGWDDIWNIVVGRPDVFVALTNDLFQWSKKWAIGVNTVKIPNGVDLEMFNPKGEKLKLDLPKPIVLSVGALSWYKHHERVIEAVAKLEGVSLLIVGDGEKRSELKKLGIKLLGTRFKIMTISYDEIPKLYRSVDLFTLPSWDREAFGIVYLEAMATNLPVVGPNDNSRKEIIGEGGVTVDVGDYDLYAKAIDKTLQSKWGAKPRSQAEKFNWDKVAKMYEQQFIKIIHE